MLGIEPDKLVVLEDAEKGLKASKEAGIPCVIVRNQLNQNLEFQDADFICENLEEVTEAIENSGHL
jgi:beta-phosphoglucomutase-like phosphatase (HAD superfamily)